MVKRYLLSSTARESFFDIPSDMASLERYYVLATDDLDRIGSRRGPENRLGLAIHIALLRHPGQGWRDSDQIPPEVIHWLSEQIHVLTSALDIYGTRESTRAVHRVLAIKHLGLRPFLRADFRRALELATQAAFGTDEGSAIMGRLLVGLSEAKLVYPGTVTLERIGLAGRARARRLAAQDLNDALSVDQQAALQGLLARQIATRIFSPLRHASSITGRSIRKICLYVFDNSSAIGPRVEHVQTTASAVESSVKAAIVSERTSSKPFRCARSSKLGSGPINPAPLV